MTEKTFSLCLLIYANRRRIVTPFTLHKIPPPFAAGRRGSFVWPLFFAAAAAERGGGLEKKEREIP